LKKLLISLAILCLLVPVAFVITGCVNGRERDEPATVVLTPNSVTINDESLIATVEVGGTATGTVTIDTDDLPAGVSASVSGTTVTVIGVRPTAEGAIISGTPNIVVTRQNVNQNLTVHLNLTTEVSVPLHPMAVPQNLNWTGMNNDGHGNNLDFRDRMVISWTWMFGSSEYELSIADKIVPVSFAANVNTRNFSLAHIEGLTEDSYEVRVRRMGDGVTRTNSEWSAPITYERFIQHGTPHSFEITSSSHALAQLTLNFTAQLVNAAAPLRAQVTSTCGTINFTQTVTRGSNNRHTLPMTTFPRGVDVHELRLTLETNAYALLPNRDVLNKTWLPSTSEETFEFGHNQLTAPLARLSPSSVTPINFVWDAVQHAVDYRVEIRVQTTTGAFRTIEIITESTSISVASIRARLAEEGYTNLNSSTTGGRMRVFPRGNVFVGSKFYHHATTDIPAFNFNPNVVRPW